MTPDWEHDDPRRCPHCRVPMERFGEDPGDTPYWSCADCFDTVLPPQNVGYATALVSGRIVDPIRPDDYPDVDAPAPTAQFDATAADPGRFLERVWERLQLVTESIRDQERGRRIEDAGRTAPAEQRQTSLDGWSA